mmetsp:Transcript_31067/g.51322  ORF Transcript_31067/g.51322 Transcript_31067/m.51322 type:complete len:188 (-) Transcript_31067:58-621(-)|eukprot:CAMPEP_0119012778 /NCGR_PEP_ID=MMETSP1176-20130426/7576_1 /TAXON_ID=265551 /ORGANISM="Synedropsis recta cf, Strain CCMP1620" /LENGTH=187 /DNA_ID=CAMNT_0006965803 /DNA_START=43 /DNA_END=606 /DNA_ORIENTATION=+
MTKLYYRHSHHRLCFSLLALLTILSIPYTSANCDVYKRTMDSIDFWQSYDFSQGMTAAIEQLYAPGAKVTSSTSSGTVTLPPDQFFGAHHLSISKMKVDVREIDCAADGAWCHLRVIATYWAHGKGETVSIPQYWTYFYDPVTCKWAHYVILQHSNDLEYMVDVLTASSAGEAEEDGGDGDSKGDEF